MAAPRVLGVIPARGGSKGIPGKNLRPLCGRPLLAWTAAAASAARTLHRVVLSTDDEAIAEAGRSLGLDVPFLRPAALAIDTAPTLPAVVHALDVLAEGGDRYDAVCLLQPTSPVRPDGLIDRCVALLDETGADSIVTAHAIPHEHHPSWALLGASDDPVRWAMGADPQPRRQDLPPAWHRDGAVYVVRTATIRSGSLYGDHLRVVATDAATSVNLDTEDDWARAEALLCTSRP